VSLHLLRAQLLPFRALLHSSRPMFRIVDLTCSRALDARRVRSAVGRRRRRSGSRRCTRSGRQIRAAERRSLQLWPRRPRPVRRSRMACQSGEMRAGRLRVEGQRATGRDMARLRECELGRACFAAAAQVSPPPALSRTCVTHVAALIGLA